MAFWKKKDDDVAAATGSSSKTVVGSNTVAGTAGVSSAASIASSSASASRLASIDVPNAANAPLSQIDEQLQERFGRVRSALGAGTVIQGKLSFDAAVRIDGKLSGEIFSSKALIIGPSGSVDARIEAAVLIVLGMVRGTVKASERIEILGSGRIEGDIRTPVFSVAEGATFQGACSMKSTTAVATEARSSSETKTVTVPVVYPKRGDAADSLAKLDGGIDSGKVVAIADQSKTSEKGNSEKASAEKVALEKPSGAPVH